MMNTRITQLCQVLKLNCSSGSFTHTAYLSKTKTKCYLKMTCFPKIHMACFDVLPLTPNLLFDWYIFSLYRLNKNNFIVKIMHLECFLTFCHCSPEVMVLWAALPLGVTLRTTVLSESVVQFLKIWLFVKTAV